MALNDLDRQRIKNTIGAYLEKRRPPRAMRHEVDLSYRITAQGVEILERRASRHEPGHWVERGMARADWDQDGHGWHLYWMRAEGGWERYAPLPKVATLQAFCTELDADPHACFWG